MLGDIERNLVIAAERGEADGGIPRLLVRIKQMHLFRYLLLAILFGCFAYLAYTQPKPEGVGSAFGWFWRWAFLCLDVFGCMVLLIALVIAIWSSLAALSIYGFSVFRNSFRTARVYRRTLQYKRFRGGTPLNAALFVGVVVLIYFTGWGLGVAAFSFAALVHAMTMQFRPASVLYLANSNELALIILGAIRTHRIEHRVVSLLDQFASATPEIQSWAEVECFRTDDGEDWQAMVRELATFVKVVAVHVDVPSEGVVIEIGELIRNDPPGEVIYICEDTSVCPALTEALRLDGSTASSLRLVGAGDAARVVAALLRGESEPDGTISKSGEELIK